MRGLTIAKVMLLHSDSGGGGAGGSKTFGARVLQKKRRRLRRPGTGRLQFDSDPERVPIYSNIESRKMSSRLDTMPTSRLPSSLFSNRPACPSGSLLYRLCMSPTRPSGGRPPFAPIHLDIQSPSLIAKTRRRAPSSHFV